MPEDKEKLGPEHHSSPVGQYYLLDKIAQGGMAEIFKGLAYDLHGIKKTVVIKKILPHISADPEYVNMLIHEAKVAVMLSHGNIAQIYDLGKVDDDYFIVMEYVDGKSLSQIHKQSLRQGDIVPIPYVCYFISEVANGLNYMHRRTDEQGRNLGIIHRDISPQNIIVDYSGTVKIIDFGIAKAALKIHITDSGVLKGKFAYMSPEQAKGEPSDHRTDIFSLGVILHELLTGKRLFKGKDKKETLANVRRARVPQPSSLCADISPQLDKIVMKALTKEPKNRYLWASELSEDLTKYLYTHHPDYKPSAITEFIQELFRKEIYEREELEEDAKTPYLIIDHTQSAILPEKMEVTGKIRIPPQLQEFMLDETTPVSEKESLEEKESVEEVTRPPFNLRKFLKTHWRGIATGFAGLLIASITIFMVGVDHGLWKIPAFLIPAPDKSKEITKIVPELPHYAHITIKSNPPGATIFIDDRNTNLVTPAEIPPLKPGKDYTVGLYLKGYKFKNINLKPKPDEKKSVGANLLANFGTLEIISTPPHVDIYLDGKHVGTTPFVRSNLVPERIIDITATRDGFTTWSKKIKIEEGKVLVLRPRLSRTPDNFVPPFLRDLDRPPPQTDEELETTEPEEESPPMLPPAPVE